MKDKIATTTFVCICFHSFFNLMKSKIILAMSHIKHLKSIKKLANAVKVLFNISIH